MAKIIPSIPGLTGRLEDITIYNRNGKTLVRKRHNEVTRRALTEAQLRYRMLFANSNNLWKSFPEDQRPQFQDRRPGVSNYNQFKSHAMQCQPIYLTKEQIANGASVVTDVAVSQGTLPPIDISSSGLTTATDIALGGLAVNAGTTVAQLSRAIVTLNPDYCHGDRLLFVLCQQLWNDTFQLPYTASRITALTLDLCNDGLLTQQVGDSTGFGSHDGFLAATHDVIGGMAWVHARQSDEGELYSTQRLSVSNPIIAQYTTPEAIAATAQSYGGFTPRPFLE